MKVIYQWCFQEINTETGTVTGLFFEPTYDRSVRVWRKRKSYGQVLLVRDQFDQKTSSAMRETLAVSDASYLPFVFSESGARVPRRFHRELNPYRRK